MGIRSSMRGVCCVLAMAIAMPACAGDVDLEPVDPSNRAEVERQMCAEYICQHDLRVVLKQKDGTTFDQTYPVFSPVVQPMGITVVAGQTVYVEADIVDGKLANLVAVDKIAHPEKTLSIHFEQDEHGGMMLRTQSPFEQTLKFDMGIATLEEPRLMKTSSCPVIKGSYEMWPYPIFLVVLGNGRVLPESGSMVCD